jgi:GAF domain-containing protein
MQAGDVLHACIVDDPSSDGSGVERLRQWDEPDSGGDEMTISAQVIDGDLDVHGEIARMSMAAHGAAGRGMPVDDVLEVVSSTARRVLPQVDHMSISLVRHNRSGRVLREKTVATGDMSRLFANTQWDDGDGPGIDAIVSGSVVTVDDVDVESRWPQLMDVVRRRTPIRSSVCVAMTAADRAVGIVVLHSERRCAFDARGVEVAQLLGVHAGIAISTARRGEQFAQALASRDVIGQAKGMIMERFGVDADRAFTMLSQLSQESNTPVAEVSGELVASGGPARSGSGSVTAVAGEGAQ